MIDHSAQFFDQIASSPQPHLRNLTATFRFDIDELGSVRHWLLDINDGTVSVSRRKARADVVVRANRALFERIATGRCNAMAAGLRGELGIDGDVRLLVAFQRLLPGPPASTPMPTATSTEDKGQRVRTGRQTAKESIR
jgi:predicted lipid carrier protein YhbT